jgi:DNA-binding Lrp family transcriptional regulator
MPLDQKIALPLSLADKDMLRLLLDSEGKVSSDELSRKMKASIGSIQEQRKRLEKTCIVQNYSLDLTKFGWRRIDLLIYTVGSATMSIGKALLKRKDVTRVARMIGEHTIDLRVEVLIKDYAELLNLIEEMKAVKGVRDVVWTEVVETIGRRTLRITL